MSFSWEHAPTSAILFCNFHDDHIHQKNRENIVTQHSNDLLSGALFYPYILQYNDPIAT